ncbi:hypothetical protein [Streptomyces sp. 8L]|uniref:hypothetical protein n=1 Tax=Streptomyces sp. 8L TaxID=2877242 RepID=UPI001CD3C5BF|nr:hypothetical protein [Streptomyces sp. 8L]MCA1217127.1 hypothetical protein [Streptomyces sp. 8L]
MAEHHWIITLQWHDPADKHTQTLDGVSDLGSSATPQDLYRHVYRWSTNHLKIDRYDPAVLMHKALPNEL